MTLKVFELWFLSSRKRVMCAAALSGWSVLNLYAFAMAYCKARGLLLLLSELSYNHNPALDRLCG